MMPGRFRRLLLPALGAMILLAGCNRYKAEQYRFSPDDRQSLRGVAERTWKCLEAAKAPATGFPADHLLPVPDGRLQAVEYTTATNVGLLLLAVPAARDFGFLSAQEAEHWLALLLSSLDALPKSHGLFYNYFNATDGRPDEKRFVSSVDNAWLAAGLWALSQTGPSALRKKAGRLYADMDFSACYDETLGQFRLGYAENGEGPSPYHYGLLCSESRLISLIAIAKGQVPPAHWYKVFRTLPADRDWQRQVPRGVTRNAEGVDYFAGYYEVAGEQVVPSWGGSLFEFLAPLLLVPEMTAAPHSFAPNHCRVVRLQMDHCLTDEKYPVWGLAPSAVPSPEQHYRYAEFGDARLGTKGYPDEGVIAPYASFLALEVAPEAALDNCRRLQAEYPGLWTEYGFFDAINVRDGQVAQVYLTLDQAMIFLALHNALFQGATRKRFFRRKMVRKLDHLLKTEVFY